MDKGDAIRDSNSVYRNACRLQEFTDMLIQEGRWKNASSLKIILALEDEAQLVKLRFKKRKRLKRLSSV